MKDKIMKEIKRLKEENEVRVLFAVEAGSRTWGVSSENSDYDVRFVYIHKIEWYLSIDEKRDVIELPVDKSLDMSGWDLQKALRLYRKSNPQFLEWLNSDLVYVEEFKTLKKLRLIRGDIFSPVTCFHHYFSMARRNFKLLGTDKEMKLKKYLNVLRPLLACLWIERFESIPPNRITFLTEKLVAKPLLITDINKLIKDKQRGYGYSQVSLENLLVFFERELERLGDFGGELSRQEKDVTPLLNEIFLETVKEVWGGRIP
jgi:uncharacterized protein